MAIYYLDIDDEITSAAARIRDSSDTRIALVLTQGARVATSRINLRLLAREAGKRKKRLAIVTADPSVQSVARSAGLPVFSTPGEYERAEAARTAGGADGPDASEALAELAATVGLGSSGGPTSVGSARGGPSDRPSRSTRGVPRIVIALSALLVALTVGLGTFFFFPSATVTLTVQEQAVGPMSLNVIIDPAVSTPDDAHLTVPGVSKAFPVATSGTFAATGVNVVETAATGTVTFTSINTVQDVPVIVGTVVSTAGGIQFSTSKTVRVPMATVSADFKLTPGKVDAPVQAVNKGLSGNVSAGAIARVSSDLAAFKVSVSNAQPTSGGTHTENPAITQSDIDGAEQSLAADLRTRFQAEIGGSDAAPSGLTLFDASAKLGYAAFDPDPQGLVGQAVSQFQLNARATGTAVLGDLGAVTALANRRIAATIDSGHDLVPGSVSTQLGSATFAGSTVELPVSTLGLQTLKLDEAKIRAALLGAPVTDARAYLSQFGTVDISLSPGWADKMPSFDFRLSVVIVEPTPTASGSPFASSSAVVLTPAPPTPVSRTPVSGPTLPGPTLPGPTPSPSPEPSASPLPASPAPTPTPAASAGGSPGPSASQGGG